MHFFGNLTPERLEEIRPASFAHLYVQGGDVLYLPAGCLICEKAVSQHNVILRATSTLVCETNAESCCLVAGACGVKNLGHVFQFRFSPYKGAF